MAEPMLHFTLRRLQLSGWQTPSLAPLSLRKLLYAKRRDRSFCVRRFSHRPADHSDFISIVDNPPQPVRVGNRHGPGVIVLGSFHNKSHYFSN